MINIYYKLGNRMVTKEEYIKEIFLTLMKYPNSDLEFLKKILRAESENDLHNFLLAGIHDYIRENKGIRFNKVCGNLKVKKEYVLEAIDFYEIDMNVENTESDSKEDELQRIENENKNKREMLEQIMAGLKETKANSEKQNVTPNNQHRMFINDGGRRRS